MSDKQIVVTRDHSQFVNYCWQHNQHPGKGRFIYARDPIALMGLPRDTPVIFVGNWDERPDLDKLIPYLRTFKGVHV